MGFTVIVTNFGGNISSHNFFNKSKAMKLAQVLVEAGSIKAVVVIDDIANKVVFDFVRP